MSMRWCSSSVLLSASGGIRTALERVVCWVCSVGLFIASSITGMRLTSYSTTFSNYSILVLLDLFISACYSLSYYSCLISCSFFQFCFAHLVRIFNCSARSSSTRVLSSPTPFSSWLPACCTLEIEASASYFHFVSAYFCASRSATCAACDRKLPTTYYRKWWTSCIYVLIWV